MQSISKSQFKVRALEFFREVESIGEPIVVTDHGRSKLEIRRYADESHTVLARLRGSVLRYDNPTEPVGEEEWDASR